MNKLIQKENLDILLVLALAFENISSEPNTKTMSQIVEDSFGAMSAEDFSALQSRAQFLDGYSKENRALWREICLEKLIYQKRFVRLDENINPAHIGNVLSREPKSIQKHILRNLPNELAQRMAQYLEIKFDSENEKPAPISKEIAELIRKEFLSNFVSYEDIYEPLEIDRLSVFQLNKFIHHLGLREIAIACRGIAAKETLASFLNSFSPDDTREIVHYLTELDKIKPFWVSQADEIVRNNWEAETNPDKISAKIGFELLAVAFVPRNQAARKYTSQKFSTKDSLYWKRLLRKTEDSFYKNDEIRANMEKRQTVVEKLAVKFLKTGRL
jgi:hypothetical protein